MVSKINIKIIDPNTREQLEHALEEMVVQQLIKNDEERNNKK